MRGARGLYTTVMRRMHRTLRSPHGPSDGMVRDLSANSAGTLQTQQRHFLPSKAYIACMVQAPAPW